MPYDESDDYDVYEIIDQAYNEADRLSRPIHILLDTYQKYEEHDPNADAVANDREALEWLDDYWEYVKWNEHGNESSIDEVGGFRGFARTVTDSDYVDSTLDYLIYDDYDKIDPTARDLADRLKIIANRYGALRKMKKMSFTERVCQYIKNNYDIPKKMEFYIGTDEYDFEDWVDAYVEEFNNNVTSPYGDDSDESDVKVVGEEILQIMTAPYKMGSQYVMNYDDFEASTKKMKKNKTQLIKSGDWIQNWVNGKVEMNSFEANGVSFSLDMSSGGGAYSNDDELIYQGKEILVYMGLPFDTDWVENDEVIYISAYDENMTELWTQPYSIYQVPTFAHAIRKLEDILRNNNIEAKSTKSAKKSQDIHSMIASIRKNNNSLKKERVDLKNNVKKENIAKMSWDDYKKLKRAYDNGTVESLINGMNNILPGYGNQFEALFEACMSVGSLKDYIFNNFVPIEMPPLVRGRTNIYDSEGNGIVQYNFDGDGLSAMIRFTVVKNTDVKVTICLWDNHQIVDDESQTYTDVDIDWIDEVFSDANEFFRGVCQSYVNMVRQGI